MPKIVSYRPQVESDDEIDIADQEPPTMCAEPCNDVIRYNKLINHTRPQTNIPSKRVRRACSEVRKIPAKRKQQPKPTTEMDVCRISMPCNTGCCYCTYSNKLGPVKVHVSSFEPQRDSLMRSIKDGRGLRVIPNSRKGDLKGLVYDKETFSLHPPTGSSRSICLRRTSNRR